MLLWVNYANETCRLFLHYWNRKLGGFLVIFAVQPIHFVWGRIYVCSSCSVHHSFVKSTLLFMFPLVIYTNEMCGLFLHSFIWKLGWYLQFACTFCHRKNLCSLQLLRTLFICYKYSANLLLLVSYTNEMRACSFIDLFESWGNFCSSPVYRSFVKSTLPLW